MGRAGGFLDFKRKDPGYRPVKKRLTDYDPVELRMEEAEVRAQAARCMDCGIPFCHGCGCPLSNVIPEWNDLVYTGRWKDALDLLLETNNFPEFTARVCPAPCETSCVLGINDDAVTIRQIEMAIVEKGFEKGYLVPRPPSERLKQKVAVVGSGPAGLAAADTLNHAGYGVTVFDRARNAGGILRYGIPDFKLEKSVVERRVHLMAEEGVVFELGVSVGDDISYKFLSDRFDAVCLATGAREPRDLPVPGRELNGIHFAMDYLSLQNMKLGGEDTGDREDINADGNTVVIIGGGDTGSDCLGTALRQGAKKVYQLEILPKPPIERPESTPWPTWPNTLRESSSHKEGGERRWSVSAREFTGKDGQLTGLTVVEVDWSNGNDGRMEFGEKPGTEFKLQADLVLLAMGFVGPGRNRVTDELGLDTDERGNLAIDEKHMTSTPGVFSAGDVAQGQSLVVRALADGRAAAMNIIDYLQSPGTVQVSA